MKRQATLQRLISWVFVTANTESSDWFDENGKFLIEHLDEFLQSKDFVEEKTGVWRDTKDGSLYSLRKADIDSLVFFGFCRMLKTES